MAKDKHPRPQAPRARGWVVPAPIPVGGPGMLGYSSYAGNGTSVVGTQFSSDGGGITSGSADGAGGGSAGDTSV